MASCLPPSLSAETVLASSFMVEVSQYVLAGPGKAWGNRRLLPGGFCWHRQQAKMASETAESKGLGTSWHRLACHSLLFDATRNGSPTTPISQTTCATSTKCPASPRP